MIKKFTATLLVMAFTQVYAATPIQQSFSMENEMNRAFDELNYRMNVEWDQTDPAYVKKALDDFGTEINVLQEQGLSSKELVQYTLEKIKDQKTRDEVNAIAKTINDNQMSPEEGRNFAISKLSNMYSHGASWSGSRMHVHQVALVLGIIALLYCCYKVNHLKNGTDGAQGPAGEQGPPGTGFCNGVDVCNGVGNGQNNVIIVPIIPII